MPKPPKKPIPQHAANAEEKLAASKRLGLYGGSFDPVHTGHLILAREAMEQLSLDYVIFIPALLSPHKEGSPPISAQDRWDMVTAAIHGENNFLADDMEILREGVSYTIDTVRSYHQKFPDTRIFYLIGGDNVPDLHTWREIESLQELVTFVILQRGNACEIPENFELVSRTINISSTEVRNRVASGQSIRYLVPEMVQEIILSRQLYVR
jgi:nicotinate-nucleotide adenylyltransferase